MSAGAASAPFQVASVQLIPIMEAAIETVHLTAETKNIQIQFTICDADQHCTSQPISPTVLSNRGNTSPTSKLQTLTVPNYPSVWWVGVGLGDRPAYCGIAWGECAGQQSRSRSGSNLYSMVAAAQRCPYRWETTGGCNRSSRFTPYGTINTGQGERLMTRLVTLSAAPSSVRPMPRQPMIIKSAAISSATSQIVKAGFPCRSIVSASIPC